MAVTISLVVAISIKAYSPGECVYYGHNDDPHWCAVLVGSPHETFSLRRRDRFYLFWFDDYHSSVDLKQQLTNARVVPCYHVHISGCLPSQWLRGLITLNYISSGYPCLRNSCCFSQVSAMMLGHDAWCILVSMDMFLRGKDMFLSGQARQSFAHCLALAGTGLTGS